MKRNNTTPIHDFLRQAHAARPKWHPTPAWRQSVMNTIAEERPAGLAGELDRLAPRFAVAAAAVSVACILTAVWMLGDVPGKLSIAFASQVYEFTSLVLWI